jgi:hypothetical protein
VDTVGTHVSEGRVASIFRVRKISEQENVWCRVYLVRTDVSEDRVAFIFGVEKINF